jgi:hypothetical protein
MTLSEILAYMGTGVFSGILAGLLGVGGGVIIVPALILVFGHQGFTPVWLAQLAVGTSLASIIGTGWSSALAHHRRGAVRWDLFWRLVPGIILGAWAGAAVAGLLPQGWLQRIFGVFLVYVGLSMLAPRGETPTGFAPGNWGLATVGGGIGALSAIVGIGGGTLTVPYLVRTGLDMRRAVATSSACGVPIALAGTLGFVVSGWGREGLPTLSTGFVYWPAVLGILLTSILTAPVGARLAHSLPVPVLSRFFGILLLLVAAKLLLD